MKNPKDSYLAPYELAPAPTGGTDWVATGVAVDPCRSFHKGLFGLGATPEAAAAALAVSIRDALHGPLAAQRGWGPDRFKHIVLVHATKFAISALPSA